MNTLANIFAVVGNSVAETSTKACAMWFVDEPECPKSLIK